MSNTNEFVKMFAPWQEKTLDHAGGSNKANLDYDH